MIFRVLNIVTPRFLFDDVSDELSVSKAGEHLHYSYVGDELSVCRAGVSPSLPPCR